MQYQKVTLKYKDNLSVWQSFDFYYTNTTPDDFEVTKIQGESKSGILFQKNLSSRNVYTFDLFIKENYPYSTTKTQQIDFLKLFFQANEQRINLTSDIDVILTNDGNIGLSQVEESSVIHTVTLNFRAVNPI